MCVFFFLCVFFSLFILLVHTAKANTGPAMLCIWHFIYMSDAFLRRVSVLGTAK